MDVTDILEHLDISVEARKAAAARDEALPDGSYPIRNKADLKRAIQSYGRASDKEKVKKWIIKRATELEATDLLPESWLTTSGEVKHHGIKGMRWGVTRTRAQLDADSADVSTAKATAEKIKANRGSTDSISNADLQTLVTRMNLEKNYRNLASPTRSKGELFVDNLLDTPLPDLALLGAKFKFSQSQDPRIKLGLDMADAIIRNKKSSKKKK